MVDKQPRKTKTLKINNAKRKTSKTQLVKKTPGLTQKTAKKIAPLGKTKTLKKTIKAPTRTKTLKAKVNRPNDITQAAPPVPPAQPKVAKIVSASSSPAPTQPAPPSAPLEERSQQIILNEPKFSSPKKKSAITDSQDDIQATLKSELLINSENEKLKDQLELYTEICSSITDLVWTPQSIIDPLYVFVRLLGFESISLILTNPETTTEFDKVVSRGYEHPPNENITSIWAEAIIPNKSTIDWGRLLSESNIPSSQFSAWLKNENIERFGYVPIHTNDQILGFLTVASHDCDKVSPVASSLLELLGDRMGLSLEVNKLKQSSKSIKDAASQEEASLKALKAPVIEIKSQLNLMSSLVKLLSNSDILSKEEIDGLTLNCMSIIKKTDDLCDSLVAH